MVWKESDDQCRWMNIGSTRLTVIHISDLFTTALVGVEKPRSPSSGTECTLSSFWLWRVLCILVSLTTLSHVLRMQRSHKTCEFLVAFSKFRDLRQAHSLSDTVSRDTCHYWKT